MVKIAVRLCLCVIHLNYATEITTMRKLFSKLVVCCGSLLPVGNFITVERVG